MPYNWFQCQENSIDPLHFEWMHVNCVKRRRGVDITLSPTHLKLVFEEFVHGFVYKRVKQNNIGQVDSWTFGRICLGPDGFF